MTVWSLGLVVALGAALSVQSARAQSALDCGALTANAQVYAYAAGQAPAQAEDLNSHPLPWSVDLAQQAGSSSARKTVGATCRNDGQSMLVNITSVEQGATGSAPANANDMARASWAPVWETRVSIPRGKQLTISVSSSVNQINCQLVAPGVAMNWAIPYGDVATTPAGATDFTVVLSCASGGMHDITHKLVSGWVDNESILIDLAVLNVSPTVP